MDMVTWIAIGSIAMAAIALINLYLIFVKPWREKPKLTMEFEMCEPFCGKAISSKFNKFLPANKDVDVLNTNWFRIRVRNSGKSVANQCIGKLTEMWEGKDEVIDQFDPTQLHWVSTSWSSTPFRGISLSRMDYEYLDVVAAQQGDESLYICGDQFPWAKYEQRAIRNYLKPGSYILHITVYGDNVDPRTKYLSLVWGGQNFKDISVEIHDTFEKAKVWLNDK